MKGLVTPPAICDCAFPLKIGSTTLNGKKGEGGGAIYQFFLFITSVGLLYRQDFPQCTLSILLVVTSKGTKLADGQLLMHMVIFCGHTHRRIDCFTSFLQPIALSADNVQPEKELNSETEGIETLESMYFKLCHCTAFSRQFKTFEEGYLIDVTK